MSAPFNIDFNTADYVHLFPEKPPSEEIINFNLDIKDAVWARQTTEYAHKEFLELEGQRIKQGAWIYIKDQLLWLPPQFYFFLQQGTVRGENSRYPDFRLKKLKEYYFKEDCRRNPNCLGSFIVKNRRDGTTTSVMSDALWEMGKGMQRGGQIGIQSRTNEDAYDPCYTFLKSHYNGLQQYVRDMFFNDIVNPKNIETRLRFETKGEKGRSIYAKYYAAGNATMDGKEMILCILDEVCKWDKNSLLATFGTYKKFILEGIVRKGLFLLFSSPSETNGRWNDEAKQLWDMSQVDEMEPNGTTRSRIHAYHSNPLHGITGMFDKYGDADPNQVYEHIIRERKNAIDLLNEVRGFPLNRKEMFESAGDEDGNYWDNEEGMSTRKIYLANTIYKNEVTKEPKYIYGNLEFKNGILSPHVDFRPNPDANEFNIEKGRFAFSELPNFQLPLNSIEKPPAFMEGCIGVDPFHLGKGAKRKGSNAGAVDWKFRSFGVEDFIPRPTFIYDCRPAHIHTFFWDMIMACIYTRHYMQYEKTSDEIERFFDDSGMGAWVLNSSTVKNPYNKLKNPLQRAEIARGKKGGSFARDVKAILNILTNKPINEHDPYLLEQWWFEPLIQEFIDFNEDETSKYNLVSGLGQAAWGAAKIISVAPKPGTQTAKNMMSYIMS